MTNLYCLLVKQVPAAIIVVIAFIVASYWFAFRLHLSLFNQLSFEGQAVLKGPLSFVFNATAVAIVKNYLLIEFYLLQVTA